MNKLTRFFLVLLRLAIGWLFLVEGYEKVHSVDLGPTTSSKPFTSAGYLKQSSGPMAPFFQWQAGGDDDAHALDCLTLDESKWVSPTLHSDWETYLARFSKHYDLDDDQRAKAEENLEKSFGAAANWLGDDKKLKELDKNTAFPGAAFVPRKTPVQRIAEYQAKVEEYRQAQNVVNPSFGEDVYKAKLRTMKADAAKMRAELLTDLETPMHDALQTVLTPEQKTKAALGPPPPPAILAWTDKMVTYGLFVMGACLLLGVFTRLNCFGGALFLIMLYLALPPFPWSPENIKTEGHYLFVNKNLIMALALLALSTTRSGMWFGLDGLLQYLNPWTYRARKANPQPA